MSETHRLFDSVLGVLKYDETAKVYRIPIFGERAYACATGDGLFSAQADSWSLSLKSKFRLDSFLSWALEHDVPHIKLTRLGATQDHASVYCYEPWRLRIVVDDFSAGWGHTWKADWQGTTLHLGRLKSFRNFLKALQSVDSPRVSCYNP